MNERDAFIAAIIEQPECDTRRLAFADWLDEHGEPERAEFVRVQVELSRLWSGGVVVAGSKGNAKRNVELQARERELEVSLSKWKCTYCDGKGGWQRVGGGWEGAPKCPACDGMKDLLRTHLINAGGMDGQLPLTWRAGYPLTVALPRLADAVVEVECPECNGWGHVNRDLGRSVCPVCDGRQDSWQPTPRLLALCGIPPWGVAIESVMVGDREPYHNAADCWLWVRAGSPLTDRTDAVIPAPVFDLLADDIDIMNRSSWRTYRTADAARLALGKAIVLFGRAER
jgi:uncharacterized protein (TIGR02996 family)